MLSKSFLLITAVTSAVITTLNPMHVVAQESSSSSIFPVSTVEDDGKGITSRSLLRSVDCESSVDITCTLDNSGLPCQGNLKVKRSDCARATNNKIPIPITIKWKYCNKDNGQQVTYTDKVTAKYKKWIKPDLFKDEPIEEGRCVELESKKSVNICKRGVTMSLKYEAYKPNTQGSYCYNFMFLRIRKQWLPEGPCSVTTNIDCKLRDGDKVGEDCSGNIMKSNDSDKCQKIPVNWQYTYCFWNVGENEIMNFRSNKSFVKIKGKDIDSGLDVTPLDTVTKCRLKEERSFINTCHDKTGSSIQVQGRLDLSQDKEDNCSSSSQMKVWAASQCDYKFIITEIFAPKDNPSYRFVEIYTPNCAEEVITEDLYLIKYKRGKTNPSYDNPISLKGLEIPADGFLVFCATERANVFLYGRCDIITMDGSAADSDGRDQIAIIKGALGTNFVILDIFGKIGEDGLGSNHDFQGGRVERKSTSTNPNGEWVPDEWIITVPSNDPDPGNWANMGARRGNDQPTRSPFKDSTVNPTKSPLKNVTFNPTMSPIKAPVFNPVASPVQNSDNVPTMSPIQISSVNPTKSPVNASTLNPTKFKTIPPTIVEGTGKGKGKSKGKGKGKGKGKAKSKGRN